MKLKMKKGFTLVEIMIVVAIIAILAAVAIPNFIKYRRSSQATACVSNLKAIQAAKEQVLLAGKEINAANLYGSTGYIKVEPHCPAQTTASYTIGDATTDPTCSYTDTDSSDTSTWHSLNRTTSAGT
jgi:prepilin-type N-terminal cleavage/methylation domain-containing protein